MTQETSSAANIRDALVVVSPMCAGGETKDQDRAHWCQITQAACVCDGVTSSPYAVEAAEFVSRIAPILFRDDPSEPLRMVCDLLLIWRRHAQRSRVLTPGDAPQAMKHMLQDVAEEQMSRAYQTTLVAANFRTSGEGLAVTVLCCGDSAFFAFAPDGTLLVSSLAGHAESSQMTRPGAGKGESGAASRGNNTALGPGDELLVKIVCEAADDPHLLASFGINPLSAHKWLVCTLLDRCERAPRDDVEGRNEQAALWLGDGDRLLVPKYLVGTRRDPQYRSYPRLPYSKAIRPIYAEPKSRSTVSFDGRGSATAVLPDHYYTGWWSHFQERFPPGTQFVLASDGFYSSFSGPDDLWAWLQRNQAHLQDRKQRDRVLKELHRGLHDMRGDDDISFVWVRPPGGVQSSSGACRAEHRQEGVAHAG